MSEIATKIIKIKSKTLPVEAEFIEQKILENKIEPLRWAIVEVEGNKLTLSVSGRKID